MKDRWIDLRVQPIAFWKPFKSIINLISKQDKDKLNGWLNLWIPDSVKVEKFKSDRISSIIYIK